MVVKSLDLSCPSLRTIGRIGRDGHLSRLEARFLGLSRVCLVTGGEVSLEVPKAHFLLALNRELDLAFA